MNVADENTSCFRKHSQATRIMAENAMDLRLVTNAVHSHIDDHCSGLDMTCGQHGGTPNSCHQNIGGTALLGKLACSRMADADRSVFMQQHQRHRLSDYIAAAHDHGLLARKRHTIPLKQ